MATRQSIKDGHGNYVQFSNPVPVTELNDGDTWDVHVLPDGLTIYFDAIRDGHGTWDIYKATRSSLSEPFENIERLPINTDTYDERMAYVTPDESEIYFSDESGIWYSQNHLNGIVYRLQKAIQHDRTALDEIGSSLEEKYAALEKMRVLLQMLDSDSDIERSSLTASMAKLKAVINCEENAQKDLLKSIAGMEEILAFMTPAD